MNLSRQDTIFLIELFVHPQYYIYLIDVYVLGKEAFLTRGSDGQTLKFILESPNIPKVFSDYRYCHQRGLLRAKIPSMARQAQQVPGQLGLLLRHLR